MKKPLPITAVSEEEARTIVQNSGYVFLRPTLSVGASLTKEQIKQKDSRCILCDGARVSEEVDHIPSKSLFF